MSKKLYELQPNDEVAENSDLAAKQDALAPGLGISISQNYSYKWTTTNYGVLYTRSVPSAGQTATAYTNVGCTSASSYVDSIGNDGSSYVPVKSGSSAVGTATLVGQTDDKVIHTTAALSITANGVSTPCTPDATTGQVNVSSLFSSENTSLVSTIDGELPIPLEAKTANFSAEDGHAYSVTYPSGTTTIEIELPSTTGASNKALIFEARFENSDTTATRAVTFDPIGSVVKFDSSDCGVVPKATTSGSDTVNGASVMSAMWNGTAWDVMWKNKS